MPTFELDGRRLHYTDSYPSNAPRTLLLIHGAGGSQRIWRDSLRELPGGRVIALDLPGHGQSDPPGRRTIAHYAVVVERFIDALALSNVVLGGHSMGGAIAMTVARQSAADVQGLILMGSGARMPVGDILLSGSINSLALAAQFIAESGLPSALSEKKALISEDLLATGAMTTFGDFLACSRFDLRLSLGEIKQPSLVLVGTEDCLVQPRFMESLARGLPHSRTVYLPGAGHFVMLERPEETASHIKRFMDELLPA